VPQNSAQSRPGRPPRRTPSVAFRRVAKGISSTAQRSPLNGRGWSAADGPSGDPACAPETQPTNPTSNGWCVVKTRKDRALRHNNLGSQQEMNYQTPHTVGRVFQLVQFSGTSWKTRPTGIPIPAGCLTSTTGELGLEPAEAAAPTHMLYFSGAFRLLQPRPQGSSERSRRNRLGRSTAWHLPKQDSPCRSRSAYSR
jgi:hypothetical protein